jgi:hypothetical protein
MLKRVVVASLLVAAACEPLCDPGQLRYLRFSDPNRTCLAFAESTDPVCSSTSVVQIVNHCPDAYALGSTTIPPGSSMAVDVGPLARCTNDTCWAPGKLGATELDVEWDPT